MGGDSGTSSAPYDFNRLVSIYSFSVVPQGRNVLVVLSFVFMSVPWSSKNPHKLDTTCDGVQTSDSSVFLWALFIE